MLGCAYSTFEHRVLHALTVILAGLRDLVEPPSSRLRLRVHVVRNEDVHRLPVDERLIGGHIAAQVTREKTGLRVRDQAERQV